MVSRKRNRIGIGVLAVLVMALGYFRWSSEPDTQLPVFWQA